MFFVPEASAGPPSKDWSWASKQCTFGSWFLFKFRRTNVFFFWISEMRLDLEIADSNSYTRKPCDPLQWDDEPSGGASCYGRPLPGCVCTSPRLKPPH